MTAPLLEEPFGNNVAFYGISATPAPFNLTGGIYGLTLACASYGTVQLEILCSDQATFVAIGTAFRGNGLQSLYLPTGTYQLLITSATGCYFGASRIVTGPYQ